MAQNSGCYYDCSQPPEELYPYPDISGIGVLIGYTATAGIVVLIIVLHYHCAHDPTENPFRKENEPRATASLNDKINQIDVVYLGISSAVRAWLRESPNIPESKTYPRLEVAFIKCVQSMSDLQILTGISILISGYIQLRCGLSAFHWQIIVLLAWFSSITHLCCLTFLRNYLYNRPTERIWRLTAMGLMLLMLLVAMVPTGGYNWTDVYYLTDGFPIPAPSDYAICYLRPSANGSYKNGHSRDYELTFSTMVISAILLTLGFSYRIVRLHKSLSVSVIRGVRKALSGRMRAILRHIYRKMALETSGLTWKRLFLYRPLLALFLTARALLDLWNSMFIEVLWMVGSFGWGLIRLLQALEIENRGYSDWSFGQVIPIVLLAAPLLTIFESFFQEEPINALSTTPVQAHTASQFDHRNTSSNTPLQERDHPDRDFYHDSNWTHLLIYLMVAYVTGSTGEILTLSASGSMKLIQLLIPTSVFVSYLPIYVVLTIWLFIILSMLLEDIGNAQEDAFTSFMGKNSKKLISICALVSVSLSLVSGFMNYFSEEWPLYFLSTSMALNFSVAVIAMRNRDKFS